MRMVLQILIVINNFGMLIVYLIIIGDVMSGTAPSTRAVHHTGLFEGWFGHHWWTGRFFLLSITSILGFAALINVRRIESLTIASALSVILALVFVVATAVVAIVKLAVGKISWPRLIPHIADRESFWKIFTIVPVIVTSYICHYSSVPIDGYHGLCHELVLAITPLLLGFELQPFFCKKVKSELPFAKYFQSSLNFAMFFEFGMI